MGHIRVRGGGPANGVMKHPGRVMAGGMVLAGIVLFFSSAFCVPASGHNRDPATQPDDGWIMGGGWMD